MSVPGGRDPLVSIGLPVFNGAPYVGGALEALLRQDHQRLELIVSDNASTDDTESICRDLAARDERVRYHRNPENLGPGANFLRVLSLARGDYFMWAAHDDLWEPRFVSALLACLERDPGLLLAMSRYDRFSHVTEERGTVPAEGYPALSGANAVFDNCVAYLRKGAAELIYGLFRTEVLRRTRVTQREPFDWWDVCLINEVCTLGRVHLLSEVLFHTGFVAPRPAKSLSKRRLPGFKLAYGPYCLESARAFLRARALRPGQKLILLRLLLVQVASMVYSYELPGWAKDALGRVSGVRPA